MTTHDYLLDTHAFLWAVTNDSQLSGPARAIFLDEKNSLHLSVASIWEMAIKSSIGRLSLQTDLRTFLDEQLPLNGIRVLSITRSHAQEVEQLPFHHRDPFDRLLVAQSVHEEMQLVSVDTVLDAYDNVKRVW
ncbi:MAG: twitching motility protein PilT [Deltaproteobacteria bacterium RIFOXYA12_FULL_58_15]|nr:MAG: twitching motility protein PilT [Deltaproteobacteria bacterium RIFOXYA12_FULL_58_15]OGR07445.1 MAG: twitching motility protein PilT [Deltaproteobacteria bacterium RIFOXYB12_FULL_58_9]